MTTLTCKQYAATAPGSFGEASMLVAQPPLRTDLLTYGAASSFTTTGSWIELQAPPGGTNFKARFYPPGSAAPVIPGDLANEFTYVAGTIYRFNAPIGSTIVVV